MPSPDPAATIPVTFALSADLHAMLTAAMPPGRTVENSIEELLVAPIIRNHFLTHNAPRDYYAITAAVSEYEIAAFRKSLADPAVQKALQNGHREEAIAFGLIGAALELCTAICARAGYKHPDQHGEGLAWEFLQQFAALSVARS